MKIIYLLGQKGPQGPKGQDGTQGGPSGNILVEYHDQLLNEFSDNSYVNKGLNDEIILFNFNITLVNNEPATFNIKVNDSIKQTITKQHFGEEPYSETVCSHVVLHPTEKLIIVNDLGDFRKTPRNAIVLKI